MPRLAIAALVLCAPGCVFDLDRPRPGTDLPGPGKPEAAAPEAGSPDGPRPDRAADRSLLDSPRPADLSPPPPSILVAAGAFTMGSPPAEGCRTKEEALHKVTLTRGYHLMETEVTQRQYLAVMNKQLSSPYLADHPVVNVNWHEAAAYCAALSKRGGGEACYTCVGDPPLCTPAFAGKAIYNCSGWRLPTEAEWEHAYRAGSTAAYYNGASSKEEHCSCDDPVPAVATLGWYCGNSGMVLHQAGEAALLPHPLGLRDLAGNVTEWVHDGFQSPLADETDPAGAGVGAKDGVVKGGSFAKAAGYMRAAMRDPETFTARYPHVGFRCARTAP